MRLRLDEHKPGRSRILRRNARVRLGLRLEISHSLTARAQCRCMRFRSRRSIFTPGKVLHQNLSPCPSGDAAGGRVPAIRMHFLQNPYASAALEADVELKAMQGTVSAAAQRRLLVTSTAKLAEMDRAPADLSSASCSANAAWARGGSPVAE
jgi:hypothetical protein